ncbi:hypothetical protein KCU62_g258, partial [Aureobasidium sp. EXF-3399]
MCRPRWASEGFQVQIMRGEGSESRKGRCSIAAEKIGKEQCSRVVQAREQGMRRRASSAATSAFASRF